MITRVQPGSPAEEAGLRAGDIITQANSKPVTSVASFRRIVEALKEKELLFVRISRLCRGRYAYPPDDTGQAGARVTPLIAPAPRYLRRGAGHAGMHPPGGGRGAGGGAWNQNGPPSPR